MDTSPSNSLSEIKTHDMEKVPSVIKERQKIKNEHYRNEWKGCCSRTDRHFLKYITQITMGGVVMVFCMAQIFIEADNPEIYFSLLSATLGLFLPHPQIKDD